MRKTVDCLVGLQWGSEGKGKVSAYLANEYNAMVRSGGPQAGHTFYRKGRKFVNRQVPCGVVNHNCLLYMSANSLANLAVLSEEIIAHRLYPNRLMIDNNAMIVTEKHARMERKASLRKRLGSTLEGVGAAQAEKIWRKGELFSKYAYEDPELFFFCNDVAEALNEQVNKGHTILLEGTQGFGLSLNHGAYPYVTSRDVTASALLSDAGISPKFHGQTIGVMRTYPIRVGGNSGPAGSRELTWDEITSKSGSHARIREYTSVTGRLRRVFEQDFELLERSLMVNRPDQIALMFADYIDADDYGKTRFEDLSAIVQGYVLKLEKRLRIPITLIGTGPKPEHMIDRRDLAQKRAAIVTEELPKAWPNNFYGEHWDSGYLEEFIDSKMTGADGGEYKRRIFVFR